MKISFPHRAGSPARRVACERSCLERRDADGLGALVPGLRLELHARALCERTEAVALDRAVMDEEVLAALVGRDEPEALVVVEPLDGSGGHGAASLHRGVVHCDCGGAALGNDLRALGTAGVRGSSPDLLRP